MPANFFFDAASDDELELLDHEEDSGSEDVGEEEAGERKGQAEAGEDEDEEEEDDEDDDDEEEDEETTGKGSTDAQSPWDFASYSSSVGEEHARRHTTSIDEKISKAMQLRPLPISVEEEEEEEEEEEKEEEGEVEEDAETDKQDEYLSEEDDAAELKSEGVAAKPFFSTVDGVSFHANSFMELNLSRPLLRACETLGYKKPTPIQV